MARSYVGQEQCRQLLSNYDTAMNGHYYSCPARLDAPDDTYKWPTPTKGPCTRDNYVDAAVQDCWAAECYATLGVDQRTVDQGLAAMTPEDAAANAQSELAKAMALCSNAPVFGEVQRCPTQDFYSCPSVPSSPTSPPPEAVYDPGPRCLNHGGAEFFCADHPGRGYWLYCQQLDSNGVPTSQGPPGCTLIQFIPAGPFVSTPSADWCCSAPDDN
ncbi:MAG: hypothetical protein ABI895_17480 [Deltaproteobacteria bacterium]